MQQECTSLFDHLAAVHADAGGDTKNVRNVVKLKVNLPELDRKHSTLWADTCRGKQVDSALGMTKMDSCFRRNDNWLPLADNDICRAQI